jgi:hypothetical protein
MVRFRAYRLSLTASEMRAAYLATDRLRHPAAYNRRAETFLCGDRLQDAVVWH